MEKGLYPARYWMPLSGMAVRCDLCPHRCVVQNGERGLCRARMNVEGAFYTLAYGNPCSVAVDPIEKKPFFHFYPASRILSVAIAGCNLTCLNCQNWEISQENPEEAVRFDLTPEKLVTLTLKENVKSIAFTYTEPTIFFEYMLETAKLAKAKGLRTVMISNGYIQPEPLTELCEWLDAANIDLKSFDDGVYRTLTGGRLNPVLETLKRLREKGVWLEITRLMVPGYSDSTGDIRNMCQWLVKNGFAETPLHFSRFFPMHELLQTSATSEEVLFEAKALAERAGIQYVYVGNVFSRNGENTNCPTCGGLLVERNGYKVGRVLVSANRCPFCETVIPGLFYLVSH